MFLNFTLLQRIEETARSVNLNFTESKFFVKQVLFKGDEPLSRESSKTSLSDADSFEKIEQDEVSVEQGGRDLKKS